MYILITFLIAAIIQALPEENVKPICNYSKISFFANQIDQHHWYFNSYLSNQQYNKLMHKLAQLPCEPAIMFTSINKTQQKIYLLGINQ